MLVAFRLFLFAAGLVVLALVLTGRGLVPEPDVRTRIGEVPSVGRSLVQQARTCSASASLTDILRSFVS